MALVAASATCSVSYVSLDNNSPECDFYYANWLQKNNRTAKAVEHLKTELELSPWHYRAQQLLEQAEHKIIFKI